MKKPENLQSNDIKSGGVFQINETYSRVGWIGAFVMATEIKSWGVVGFVHHVKNHDEAGSAYIRIKWEDLEPIGHAALILE